MTFAGINCWAVLVACGLAGTSIGRADAGALDRIVVAQIDADRDPANLSDDFLRTQKDLMRNAEETRKALGDFLCEASVAPLFGSITDLLNANAPSRKALIDNPHDSNARAAFCKNNEWVLDGFAVVKSQFDGQAKNDKNGCAQHRAWIMFVAQLTTVNETAMQFRTKVCNLPAERGPPKTEQSRGQP